MNDNRDVETGKKICIIGKPSTDWLIRSAAQDKSAGFVSIPGGTSLIAEIIKRMNLVQICGEIHTQPSLDNPTIPGTIYRSGDFSGAVRISEPIGKIQPSEPLRFTPIPYDNADICVIDIRDLEYWSLPESLEWLRKAKQSFKMSGAVDLVIVAGKSFFSEQVPVDIFDLFVHCGEKVTVLCDIDDLRCADILISRNLSWERTAIDLVHAFETNSCVHMLRLARRCVVGISYDGAFIAEISGSMADYTLVYDPLGIEGAFASTLTGQMPGRNEVLVSWIVRSIVHGESASNVPLGAALSAMRKAASTGLDKSSYSFPYDSAISPDKNMFSSITVPRDVKPEWTILSELDRRLDRQGLEVLAESTVKYGVEKAIFSQPVVIPVGKVGGVTSVDRGESENLRAIYNIINQYVREANAVRPLSIAVFGAPGSGKSFGVKQIITAIVGKDAKGKPLSTFIELNMSQITTTDSLIAALHQVRDANLKGLLPVLFFDEFDSAVDGKPLFWLKNFLAPMQDGEFREGEALHPIGRSIFVFAGGTSHSFEVFARQGEITEDASTEEQERKLAFVQAKGPDFVSRLRGFINVLGPNRVVGRAGLASRSEEDPLYIIRRAVFIYNILKGDAPGIASKDGLRVDPGIVRAMLKTPRFKHGVRSISAFVQMCRLADTSRVERSHLPDIAQLELHVDSQEFLKICNEDSNESYIELWARALHETYLSEQQKAGWKYGDKKDPSRKTNPLLVDFDKLDPFFRESNLDCARSIPAKLKILGYGFKKQLSKPAVFEFPQDVIDAHIDRIAEFEHDRWYRFYVLNGWKWAPKRNDDKKEHNLIVPYRELSEEEKFKDAAVITVIPKVLGETGFEVYRV